MSLWNTLKDDFSYLKAKVTPSPSFNLQKVEQNVSNFGRKLQPMATNTAKSIGNFLLKNSENVSRPISNYFAPTPNVRARDIIREIPKATFDVGKSILQAPARFGGTAVSSFAEPIVGRQNATIRPGKYSKYLFGNETIKPIQQQAQEYAAGAKKMGFGKGAQIGAMFLPVGMTALDSPLLGGEGKAVKMLAKDKRLLQVAKELLAKEDKNIIDPDIFKKIFKDFNPANHEKYSQMAKEYFSQLLTENKNPTVKFLAGGSGSGKSELLLKKIKKEFDGIIYDGTMADYDSAVKKLQQTIKSGKNIEINAILPRIESAWKYVQKRALKTGRDVPLNEFVKKHVGFVDTLKKLTEDGYHVRLKDTRNAWSKKEALGTPFTSKTDEILAKLNELRYNKDELERKLKNVSLSEKTRRKVLAELEREKRTVYPETGREGSFRSGNGTNEPVRQGTFGESSPMAQGFGANTGRGIDQNANLGSLFKPANEAGFNVPKISGGEEMKLLKGPDRYAYGEGFSMKPGGRDKTWKDFQTRIIKIKGKDGVEKTVRIKNVYTPQPGSEPKNLSTVRKLFTGGENILNKSGEGGKKLYQSLESQRKNEDLLRGEWNVHIDKSLNGLSESEILNVDRVLRGEAKPINAKTAGASKKLRNWFDAIGKKAETMGFEIQNSKGDKTPFKMRSNYAPQMYDFTELQKGEQRDKALQHLISSGQARNLGEATKLLDNFIKQNAERRFGNLEKAREIQLPGFIRDPRIYAKKYAQSIAKRFSEVEHFGMKDSKAARYIDQIAQEGGDYNEAQRIFDYTAKGAPQNKVVNAVNQYNLATQLDLSAITNATQSINTAAKAGVINTAKGAVKGFTKQGKEVAELAGVYDDFIHSKETGVNLNKIVKAVMWPFQKVENFNRRTAANTGVIRAQQLAEGEMTDFAKRELQSLGIDPANIKNGQLSKDDMLSAAYEMARKTQFKVDPIDVPPAWKTPAGKLFSQFQSFSFMQSKFIRDEVLKEAKKGNFAPLVRFIPLAIAGSYAANYVRNLATGRDPNDASKDMDIRAWDKWGKAFGDFATGKIIQGKFLYDTFNNDYNSPLKKVSRVASSIGGPTVGKAGAVLTALEYLQNGREKNAQSKIAIAKGTKEPVDAGLELERFASGEIPFAGEMIKNKVFAYPKSKYSPEQKAQFAKDEMKQNINAILIGKQRGTISPEEAQSKIKDLQKEYSNSVGLINTANAATVPQTTQNSKDKGYEANPTGGFSYFDANGDWKTAKTEKQARIGVAKVKFAESDKSIMDLGDTVLRKTPDGSITSQSKDSFMASYLDKRMTNLQKNKDFDNWIKSAKLKMFFLKRQLNDKNVDPYDRMDIQNKIDTLEASYIKNIRQGGFTKGRKAPKMPKFQMPSMPSSTRRSVSSGLTLGQVFKAK